MDREVASKGKIAAFVVVVAVVAVDVRRERKAARTALGSESSAIAYASRCVRLRVWRDVGLRQT